MARIRVDGTYYEVEDGDNLLHACLSAGLDVPYFCWHPALGSVGACRQCAVKQYDDDGDGNLVMACMTPVEDGAVISIDDEEARAFRASVIEWMMIDHPHDCPVCEEGGECHLQDVTVMTGHHRREYRFDKRTWRNQDLGPFLNHEMNRCITCYRCTRFYQGYAGGSDLEAMGGRDRVFFGRAADGPLDSPFSGNLAEVCPTGVFTDRPFSADYSRKWDLAAAPSVCVHCAAGCNVTPNERYGRVKRVLNRFNAAVNGYFLCDRGRFGHGYAGRDDRPVRTQLAGGRDGLAPVDADTALRQLGSLLGESGRVVGIGSPRASLEANFALRALVGPDRFHNGMGRTEGRLVELVRDVLQAGACATPTLPEVEAADAVLVLGEDVTATAPRLALALRQTVRNAGFEKADDLGVPRWQDASVRDIAQDTRSPLFTISPDATALDGVASGTLTGPPEEIARLGVAIAGALGSPVPDVPDLEDGQRRMAERIARALSGARRPLVVSGTGCASAAVIQAASDVASSLCRAGSDARLALVVPECNSLGVALLGGHPTAEAFDAVRDGRADAVIVLENDLFRRFPAGQVAGVLDSARHVIVLDHVATRTVERATAVLPAAAVAESGGTLVSAEGRAQRFLPVMPPPGEIRESWRWLCDLARQCGRGDARDWTTLDEVTDACAAAVPALAGVPNAAARSPARTAGNPIPRQPFRYSGRTAIDADRTMHEPPPPPDPDSPLAYSMEGAHAPGRVPAGLLTFAWAPRWNSVQAYNKFQHEVGGRLAGGPPGVRLIEPAGGARRPPFGEIPGAFRAPEGDWRVVPLHAVFGAEELSALSPPVAERAGPPFVALNPDDARTTGLDAGEEVEVVGDGLRLRLPVRLRPGLASGTVGLPAGLMGLDPLMLPRWARLGAGELDQ